MSVAKRLIEEEMERNNREQEGAQGDPTDYSGHGYKGQSAPPPGPLPLFDLIERMSSEERKRYPVYTGFIAYFRDAIFRVARVSYEGNRNIIPMSLRIGHGASPMIMTIA